MHTHTLLYKILVEDIFGEAKTTSISEDFKSEWPKVLEAIKTVERTGRAQQLFISGKSVSYKNYEAKMKVIKIKVTVMKATDNDPGGYYDNHHRTTRVAGRPKNYGTIEVSRWINHDAIFLDFSDRISQARGDMSKVSALKKGLINKLKRYGVSENYLSIVLRDITGPAHILDRKIGFVKHKLEKAGELALGEIRIFTRPFSSAVDYKNTFYHELSHAFDPKGHLPYRIKDIADVTKKSWAGPFYKIDPEELDASINGFGATAEELPDEFNAAVKDILIKRDLNDDEMAKVVDRYQIEDDELVMNYLDSLYRLHYRIKQISDEDTVGLNHKWVRHGGLSKIRNKFMQKLINILDKPKATVKKSLPDRLSSYKDSKKQTHAAGLLNKDASKSSI